MFAWICPKCGREVPPSETECPDCAARSAAEPAAVPPPEPSPAPTPPKAVSTRKGTPGWLLTLLFAMGFLAVGSGAYYGYVHFAHARRASTTAPALEAPSPPEAPRRSSVAPYIEVAGIRLTEDARQKVQVQCVVINHSAADIAGLEATVMLRVREGKTQGRAVGNFSFRLPSLGPYESREIRTVLDTSLRAYEIPDWQFLDAEVAVTAP